MESKPAGAQGSGESEHLQTQETEPRSNRSSASFFMASRPNSLEIALKEAFKHVNYEADLSGKFQGEIDGNVVREEIEEHLDLQEDSLQY
jgi:hypothetical protein